VTPETEGLRESMESLKESKTNKIEIYSRKNKSIPRNPSRDITPLEKKQSNSSYIANLEKSLKGKKGMEKNLLINFKKIYNNSKKEKEYSINN
jgi:hypothetical protein